MFDALRRLGVLGLAGLLLAATAGDGYARQTTRFDGIKVNANPTIRPGLTLGQYAYNTAVLGSAFSHVPPYALGYNPYMNALATTPSLAGYGLSTVAGTNPYLGGAASLSTSPYGGGYSLSTTPGGGASSPYGYYPPYSYIPPTAANYMGLASLTQAQGQYWKDISQARITRETSRQMALDTARKTIELERWYEATRPTSNQLRDKELATELDRARKDPPATDVWSGRSLNELLRSIKATGAINRGPNLPLDDDTLKHINLTTGTSGNIGMLKDDGRLAWPLPLKEAQFAELQKSLDKNLRRAVADLKGKDPVDSALLNDINKQFKELNDKLGGSTDELSPGQYIEAKRYLNQLSSAIKALQDPKAPNYFNNTWNAKGKNAAELVANMSKEGLMFAPAAPGDEGAYTALYQVLRTFEAGLQMSQRRE